MPITDAFAGTNGTGIAAYSGNWEYVSGSGTVFQIQSNAIAMTNALGDFQVCARRTDGTFPNDQYAQIKMTTAPDSSATAEGPAVRCQAAGSQDFYGFYQAGGNNYLFEFDGTTWTQLGTAAYAPTANDVFKLAVSGTTLTPNINGATTNTCGAQTSATYGSGNPGITGYDNAEATSVMRLDDFECSDVSGGGVVIPVFMNQYRQRHA